MKARLLKKMLNDTDYIVHFANQKICISSSLAELITLNPVTRELKYNFAFAGYSELTASHEYMNKVITNVKLLTIWNKLKEISTNDALLNEIAFGADDIENPIPIYWFDGKEIRLTHTDFVGWPNVTFDGVLMFDNTHFASREKCLQNALESVTYQIEHYKQSSIESLNLFKEHSIKYFESQITLQRLKNDRG